MAQNSYNTTRTQKSTVMKSAILILALFGVSFAFGQTESRTEKKLQRYENGELIEDKYYLEENGRVIEGEDFDTPEFQEMEAKMAAKRLEMDQRMQDMQRQADEMMQKSQSSMDQRMQEMQQRMNTMQQEMNLKMQEMQPSKAPQMAPQNGSSAPSSLGTTFQT